MEIAFKYSRSKHSRYLLPVISISVFYVTFGDCYLPILGLYDSAMTFDFKGVSERLVLLLVHY